MNLPANLEKILFQTVKTMKTLLALIVIRSIAEKEILIYCACGHCLAMETEIESFSCRDTNEAPDNYFEGHKCITEQEDFKMVCLSKPVPDAALSPLRTNPGFVVVMPHTSLLQENNILSSRRTEFKTRVVCLIPSIFHYLNDVIFPAFPQDRFEAFIDTNI